MSIYRELLEAAKNGNYKISLQNKTLVINGKEIIENGLYKGKTPLIKPSDLDGYFYEGNEIGDIKSEPWVCIRLLYELYKYSIPDKKWSDRKSVFKALPLDLISDEDMATNHSRYVACAMLEGYILLASLEGWLKWEREDHWYWVNKYDRECIVLKQWIV